MEVRGNPLSPLTSHVSRPRPVPWTLFVDGARPGWENMAVDAALMTEPAFCCAAAPMEKTIAKSEAAVIGLNRIWYSSELRVCCFKCLECCGEHYNTFNNAVTGI